MCAFLKLYLNTHSLQSQLEKAVFCLGEGFAQSRPHRHVQLPRSRQRCLWCLPRHQLLLQRKKTILWLSIWLLWEQECKGHGSQSWETIITQTMALLRINSEYFRVRNAPVNEQLSPQRQQWGAVAGRTWQTFTGFFSRFCRAQAVLCRLYPSWPFKYSNCSSVNLMIPRLSHLLNYHSGWAN